MARPVIALFAHCGLVFLFLGEIGLVHMTLVRCRGDKSVFFKDFPSEWLLGGILRNLPAEWPFHLLDGMVLVGVAVLGVGAAVRAYLKHHTESWRDFFTKLGGTCGPAALEWTGHSAGMAAAIFIVYVLGVGLEEFKLTFSLFGKVQVNWFLDATELGFVVGLGGLGGFETVKAYYGH